MPEALKFDPAAFAGLTSSLDNAASSIKQATSALKGASAADLGSHGIDNAAQRFQERWSDGIAKIADAAETLVSGMKQASASYNTTDSGNSQLIKAVAGAVSGGDSNPRPSSLNLGSGN